MKMNEIIRRYRKERKLTQEQVASYLGVTAPAVNKWESGISCPDVSLLAPLARVLGIDVNTLLSFREEMTDLEISRAVEEISREALTGSYRAAFERGRELIRQYPECDKLTLNLALVLNMYLSMEPKEEQEPYEKQLRAWLETIACCGDRELAGMALISLCRQDMDQGRYEQAHRLLDQIPSQGVDKRLMEINLYHAQDMDEEAYRLCETMIYQNANNLIASLSKICQLLCDGQDYDMAQRYAELARAVAEQFDLGAYIAGSAQLQVEAARKNKEGFLKLLKEMAGGINMEEIQQSSLFRHIPFKKQTEGNGIKSILKKALEEDEEMEFVRHEPAFQEILKQLEESESSLHRLSHK